MKYKYWFLASLFVLFVLILNSRYWFLPLSPLLYPERVVTVSVIPFSYFLSFFFVLFLQLIVQAYRSRLTTSSSMLIFFLILLPSLVLARRFIAVATINYRQMIASAVNRSPVTSDDLRAFSWIAVHTSMTDVFLNDYNDASVWIPAIAYRKIIVNHKSPYDFGELSEGFAQIAPSYLYIGSKNISGFPSDSLLQQVQRRFRLVFSSGKARVYRITE